MESDDGRLIARFQRLTTELLAEKRLGQWHPELVDELYRASLELEERGGKSTLKTRLSGNFPGSPITVNFSFVLSDGKIRSLEIRS